MSLFLNVKTSGLKKMFVENTQIRLVLLTWPRQNQFFVSCNKEAASTNSTRI